MSDQTDVKSSSIDVDLEQWRREINTFAAATNSALDGIISELSITCGGGQVRPTTKRSSVQATAMKAPFPQQPERTSTSIRTSVSTSSPDGNSSSVSSASRLASLKEKLASRINKQ